MKNTQGAHIKEDPFSDDFEAHNNSSSSPDLDQVRCDSQAAMALQTHALTLSPPPPDPLVFDLTDRARPVEVDSSSALARVMAAAQRNSEAVVMRLNEQHRVISAHDIWAVLDPKGWVESRILDSWSESLMLSLPNSIKIAPCDFFTACYYNMRKRRSERSTEDSIKEHGSHYDVRRHDNLSHAHANMIQPAVLVQLYVPINDNNQHWLLLHLNCEQKTLTLYDSLRGNRRGSGRYFRASGVSFRCLANNRIQVGQHIAKVLFEAGENWKEVYMVMDVSKSLSCGSH